MRDVDAVITWVDGSDPAWLAQKAEYAGEKRLTKASSGEARYRQWDNLQYIFRGIETYMPWVRHVYLITWGHLPSWLNTENENLRIVRHEDFIPEDYRPTFNSNVIELNLHRIQSLSDCFISFNDDMFVLQPTKREDFFVGDRPKDTAILTPFVVVPDGIAANEMNNLEIINKYFSRDNVLQHFFKWVNFEYGPDVLRTLIFMQWKGINGVFEPHIPLSLKKSTLAEIWDREGEALDMTCRHRFRSKEDVMIWIVRQWQLMKGDFEPRRKSFGQYYVLPKDLEAVLRTIEKPGKRTCICINDSLKVKDMEAAKARINRALEQHLPVKSSFEL